MMTAKLRKFHQNGQKKKRSVMERSNLFFFSSGLFHDFEQLDFENKGRVGLDGALLA